MSPAACGLDPPSAVRLPHISDRRLQLISTQTTNASRKNITIPLNTMLFCFGEVLVRMFYVDSKYKNIKQEYLNVSNKIILTAQKALKDT